MFSRNAQDPGPRGGYNIAQGNLAGAIELLIERSRPSLSDDRSSKDPY